MRIPTRIRGGKGGAGTMSRRVPGATEGEFMIFPPIYFSHAPEKYTGVFSSGVLFMVSHDFRLNINKDPLKLDKVYIV